MKRHCLISLSLGILVLACSVPSVAQPRYTAIAGVPPGCLVPEYCVTVSSTSPASVEKNSDYLDRYGLRRTSHARASAAAGEFRCRAASNWGSLASLASLTRC